MALSKGVLSILGEDQEDDFGRPAPVRSRVSRRALDILGESSDEPEEEDESGLFRHLKNAGKAAFSTFGEIVGLPKALSDKYVSHVGENVFGIQPKEGDTSGRLLRYGLGLGEEESNASDVSPYLNAALTSNPVGLPIRLAMENETLRPYVRRALGKGTEFTADIATDPLTVAAPSSRAASVAFTGLMGKGALEEGQRAHETFQREGLSPRFAEEALGTALSAGGGYLAGKHALAGHPTPNVVDRAPEPNVGRLSADPNLNPELIELRRRFDAEKAAEAAQRPPQGIPDPMDPAPLDEALSAAADDVRTERIQGEIQQEIAAEPATDTSAYLSDETLRGIDSALDEATGVQSLADQQAAIEDRFYGRDRRVGDRRVTAPEPVQVGAIAGDQGVVPPQTAPLDLTPERPAETTFNPDVTQPLPFNPDVTQPIPMVELPEPGNVKPATIFQPETRVPEGTIPAERADLVNRQANLLREAGLEDFPLVPEEARGLIFDGDTALNSLKSRGQGKAFDLGSAAAEGVGAVRDLAVYGASLLEKGIRSFPEWSRAMTESLGSHVKNVGEHLQKAWEIAQALYQKHFGSEVGAVGKDITPLLEAERARKAKPIPEPTPPPKVAPETPGTDTLETARKLTDEDFAQRVEKGKLSEAEKKALDERLYERMVAREESVKGLNEARAANGDVAKANADLIQKSLDYVTSFGLFTKDQAAARRAMAAAAKVREAGPQAPDAFLRKVFREIPGISNQHAATLLDVFQTRPDAFPDALRAAMKPGAFKKFLEVWKAGLLSGPSTHIANLVGNTIEQGVRAAETAVAAGLDMGKGANKERFVGELGSELVGASHGFAPAWKAALNELWSAATLKPETAGSFGKLDHPVGAIGGKAGRAVRAPFRLLGAADEFFKTMFGEAELYKLAYRKAARELQGKGNIKARAAEIIREAHSDTGQHTDLIQAVAQSKLNRTFQQEPGAIAQGITRMTNNVPILEMVAPFKKTPANITRATIGRSPAGFVPAFKKLYDYRKGRATKGEVLDSFARPLVGTAIMAGFGTLAKQGFMTGGGPTDDKQKNLLRDSGWQPYSFIFKGEDGKKTYVPYNRFEPVSSLLGIVADMNEAKSAKDTEDLFTKGLGSIGENLTNKTYLQGISDAVEAWNDPKRFASQYAASTAGSLVPNIVTKAARALDPKVRDVAPEDKGLSGTPERALNTIKSRIPGLSQTLPARKSALGEEVTRPGSAFERAILPVQSSTEKPGSDLERLLVELDISRSAPGREVTIPNSKGKKIRLTDEELAQLSEGDKQAAKTLRRNTRSSDFRRMSDEDKKKYVERVLNGSRDQARKRLWSNRTLRKRASMELREARG